MCNSLSASSFSMTDDDLIGEGIFAVLTVVC